MRPSGPFHLASVTDRTLVEGHADGRFTARGDLAAALLGLLDDDRHVRSTVSVVTTVENSTLFRWIRQEALTGKERPAWRRAARFSPPGRPYGR